MTTGLVRLILLEARRARLVWIILVGLAITFGLAQFVGQVAIVETREVQAAIMAAMLRLAGAFIVIMFVVTSMVREANDKVLELMLSLPYSRGRYYLGKFAGYGLVAILIGVIQSAPLWLMVPGRGLAIWTLSLGLELLVVATFSLFCVLSLTQTVAAMAASSGLYLLARSLGTLQVIADAAVSHEASPADTVINLLVDAVALLLPSLDQLTQTAWLTAPPDFGNVIRMPAQVLAYVAVFAIASLFDLYRKNG